MTLFAAVEDTFRMRHSALRLHSAFSRWRKVYAGIRKFSDVEDFLDRREGNRLLQGAGGDAALADLCAQAARGGRHGAADDDATCLLLWVLLGPLITRSHDSDIATPLDADDAQAEIAAGVWEEVVRVVPGSARVASRLINAGRRRARRAARAEFDYQLCKQRLRDLKLVGDPGVESAPERVVALACSREVINEAEADLIVSTRLGGERLKAVAERRGITPKAATQRRHRAETRLFAWLREIAVPSRHAAGARAAYLTSLDSKGVSGLRPSKQRIFASTEKRKGVMPRPSDGPANHLGRGPDAVKPSGASETAHGNA